MAASLTALLGAAGAGAWFLRPEAQIERLVKLSDQYVEKGNAAAAWTELQHLKTIDSWAADYYQAKFLLRSSSSGQDPTRLRSAADMLRRASADPSYGDRARTLLAELLVGSPELARSPDEAIFAMRAAARNGNKQAKRLLAEDMLKRPESDKTEVFSLLESASEADARAGEILTGLIEDRKLESRSPYLVADLRYRAFINNLKEAEAGAASAMVAVGDAYRDGAGVRRDLSMAGLWYDRAVARNSNAARLRQIGLLHLDGKPESAAKAHKLALEAAKAGTSIGAFTELALDFKYGRGVTANAQQAESYLRLAAAKGAATARYELADTLLKRTPALPESINEAFLLLNQAAQGGNSGAAWRLYEFHDKGMHGLTQDRRVAFNYLVQAARAGRLTARIELAVRYDRGDEVVAKNAVEAFRWAASAVEAGATSPRMLIILGDAYAAGEVVQQDRLRAKGYLEAAVRQNDPRAMRKLGNLHFELPEDNASAKAVNWLRQAAIHGETYAYVDLGRAYASGAGVPIDSARAFAYFDQAAKAGNLDGLVEMGRSYATGYGVNKDPVLAAATFRRAAEAGSGEGMILLSYCYESGDGVDKSVTEARSWVQRSAAINNPEGLYWYGVYLVEGRGGPSNRSEGIAYLNRAKDGNFKPASGILSQLLGSSDGSTPLDPAPKPISAFTPTAAVAKTRAAETVMRTTSLAPTEETNAPTTTTETTTQPVAEAAAAVSPVE
ncbi:tetratricopeptide repeat protein [Asticcacaulis sp. AC402]|uniref:tetratricopeptide repeat protein n=1 Tax=Asticcacaulis sp. AC402 TaxID=1282361 RepID=UPI0003C3CC63|nr:tetratricopeptide repeat protein [Asticcacaulis sp. AC402]ESQ74206.1 hypothetical protein ABAC402_15480 [Asticcacaulis sp. AC402]